MEAWRWDNACLMIGGDVHLVRPPTNKQLSTQVVLQCLVGMTTELWLIRNLSSY